MKEVQQVFMQINGKKMIYSPSFLGSNLTPLSCVQVLNMMILYLIVQHKMEHQFQQLFKKIFCHVQRIPLNPSNTAVKNSNFQA